MMPLRELLNRIRWDRGFARGRIELGYFDRVAGGIIRVPFRQVRFPPDRREVFELVDAGGVRRRIPLHRVREVRVEGNVIWRRPG